MRTSYLWNCNDDWDRIALNKRSSCINEFGEEKCDRRTKIQWKTKKLQPSSHEYSYTRKQKSFSVCQTCLQNNSFSSVLVDVSDLPNLVCFVKNINTQQRSKQLLLFYVYYYASRWDPSKALRTPTPTLACNPKSPRSTASTLRSARSIASPPLKHFLSRKSYILQSSFYKKSNIYLEFLLLRKKKKPHCWSDYTAEFTQIPIHFTVLFVRFYCRCIFFFSEHSFFLTQSYKSIFT